MYVWLFAKETSGERKRTDFRAATKYCISMEARDRQAGVFQNPNNKERLKEGLNSVQEKSEGKRCYRCDATGSLRMTSNVLPETKNAGNATRSAILQSAVKLKR